MVFIFSSSPSIEANYVGAVRVDGRNIEQVCSQKQPMPLPQNGLSGNTKKGSGRSSAPKAINGSSLVFESADNAVFFKYFLTSLTEC